MTKSETIPATSNALPADEPFARDAVDELLHGLESPACVREDEG